MGLLDWLRRVFLGQVKRDVARLSGAGDAATEYVETRGPLRKHHRRLARRDPRLLPKVARLLRRRKKVMSGDEARRLFGGTLRTRNRRLRDLTTDEDQLARLSLPPWRTAADVAAALELSVPMLRFFSIHRARERAPHYVEFAIPKRSGGTRLIQAPRRRLKALQRALLPLLVDRLPVSDAAHGFRRARSVRTGAEPHVGKAVLLHADLADFFPTITFARVTRCTSALTRAPLA